MIYEVHSLIVPEFGDAREVVETRRTDKGVAYDDMNIIRGILHRKAWVVEVS